MRKVFFCLAMIGLLTAIAFGETENPKIIKAKLGPPVDISQAAQERYKQWLNLREKIYNKQEIQHEDLTPEQRKLLGEFDESQGFWATETEACSWYCGGGPKKQEASSFLSPQNGNTYFASNAHDFDLRTAWVEGAKGYGIGEYIEYYFEALSPRITEIRIYNGYFKSEQAWEDNSRVKRFKLYVNNRPYAILELYDTRAAQFFPVEPLQSKIKGKDLVLKFEISDVFKGKKWEDVAISEINFNGLDVHCFTKGTMITMADGTERAIEHLKIGDKVMSYNIKSQCIENAIVKELAKAIHHNLTKLDFGEISVISTDDHPYFVKEKGWCSVNPKKTRIYMNMEHVKPLRVGDKVYFLDSKNKLTSTVLKNISHLNQNEETFTITKLDKNTGFFANRLFVGTEELNP